MNFAHSLHIVLVIGKHIDIFILFGGGYPPRGDFSVGMEVSSGNLSGRNFTRGEICQNSYIKFTHFPRENFSMGNYHQE